MVSIFSFHLQVHSLIRFFDMEFAEHQLEIKQRVGFVSGGIVFTRTNGFEQLPRQHVRFIRGGTMRNIGNTSNFFNWRNRKHRLSFLRE